MSEKIYQFNEYVLGYDKGKNDRSCLVISKYLLDKVYVMAELYDGSAEIISTILDSLQQEIKDLQQENKQLKENNKSYQEEMARTWKKNDNLKSILTELEEYLIKITKNGASIEKITCSNILVYLKELKEKYK